MPRLPIIKPQTIANKDLVSSEYGERWTSPGSVCTSRTESAGYHRGIDFVVPVGIEVFPIVDGTVVRAIEDNTNLGKVVVIAHPDGNYSIYAHLSEISTAIKIVQQKTVREMIYGKMCR